MMPEAFIETHIFKQLVVRGFSCDKSKQVAVDAVDAYREHKLPSGVGFVPLLEYSIKLAGKPPVRSNHQQFLFDACIAGNVKLRRRDKNSRTWHAEFTAPDGNIRMYKYLDDVVSRIQLNGYLSFVDEYETVLVPAENLEWFPSGVKKVAA